MNQLPPPGTGSAYFNTVDGGMFQVDVYQEDANGYAGTLVIRVATTGEVLVNEPVTVSYEARFGSDVSDVAMWESRAITAIDAYLERSDLP